eukprot:TRINITY_DN613_c0_g1_i1.p1 TRINITY_DN613_c0_g1~~TRINITY_DN613_c0_g1_i1.p1  ORF type:complete len:177 (-),score=27.01 TRINITY_DN613_c0_g1_i1:25-510(-)
MQTALEWSSLTNTSLFAGSALYVSLAAVPGLYSFPSTAVRVQSWESMIKHAVWFQRVTSAVGACSSLALWYRGGDQTFLYSGLALAAVGPFTWFLMPLANKPLASISASIPTSGAPAEAQLNSLIKKWSWFHAVRTVVGCASVGLLFKFYIDGHNKLPLFK